MIKINGSIIPTPTDVRDGFNDIVDANRNANGKAIVEFIATKKKLDIEYGLISADDYQNVLSKLKNSYFFQVEYPDPLTKTQTTKTFYVGGITANGKLYDDDLEYITYWQGVTFSLIEQ